jgi:hypothetical protein
MNDHRHRCGGLADAGKREWITKWLHGWLSRPQAGPLPPLPRGRSGTQGTGASVTSLATAHHPYHGTDPAPRALCPVTSLATVLGNEPCRSAAQRAARCIAAPGAPGQREWGAHPGIPPPVPRVLRNTSRRNATPAGEQNRLGPVERTCKDWL